MPSHHTNISLTTGTLLRFFLIGLGLWLAYLLGDIILVLLTAIVLASAIEPFADFMARYRVPRVASVLLVYAAFFGLLLGVVYFFVPNLIEDLVGVASHLPEYLGSIEELGSPALQQFIDGVFPLADIIPTLQGAVGTVSGSLFKTASSFFGGALSLVLILLLSFYLSVQEGGIDSFLRFVSPPAYESYVLDLWKRARKKIGLWMQGQLLLGLIVGLATFVALSFLGVKYALLLAVLAAVFEIIPVFGPIMAAIPALVIAFGDSTLLGFKVLAFFIAIQQIENHLIYPLVVRKVVGVPPLVVILALIIGGKLAGALGVIISVPFAAALMELVADIEKNKQPKAS